MQDDKELSSDMPMTLKSVSIVSNGSRGDIQPYIAIALALKGRGYKVQLMTNSDHQEMVESFGLCHVSIFGSCREAIETSLLDSMASGDTFTFFKEFGKVLKSWAPNVSQRFHTEMTSNRPDLLLIGTLAQYFELYAGIHLSIPTLVVGLQAFSKNKNRAMLGFPTLPFGLHNFLIFQILANEMFNDFTHYEKFMANIPSAGKVLHRVNRKAYNAFGLEPKVPVMICQSSLYRPILHPNIHSNYNFVGPAFIPTQQEIVHSKYFGDSTIFQQLEKFIDQDKVRKPIYMGWGSLICKSPVYMVKLAVQALQEANQRGIILGGFSKLSMDVLRKATTDKELISYAETNVCFIEMAPHEWLFKRVAAVVHHGGAGTTNACLRSGVPTIITPIFLDQFDMSYVIEELGVGVGFSKQFQKISAKELGCAIKKVLDDKMKFCARARDISKKVRTENGSSTVVKQVELYWKDYVVTDEWKRMLSKDLKEVGSENEGNNMKRTLLFLGIVVTIASIILSR